MVSYSIIFCILSPKLSGKYNFISAEPLKTRHYNDGCIVRCDNIFPCQKLPTYVNVALNQQSCIDYVLTSAANDIKSFAVVDPSINFSDHLPLIFEIVMSVNSDNVSNSVKTSVYSDTTQYQLSWDKANKESYYYYTGAHLSPLVSTVDDALQACAAGVDCIESVYCTIVSTLMTASRMFIPTVKKGFFLSFGGMRS